MKKVWKYTLASNPRDLQDSVTIAMPRGATILNCAAQRDVPCLWALVDPQEKLIMRAFRVFGTGHSILDADLAYCGTFMLFRGELVFHVFEDRSEYVPMT